MPIDVPDEIDEVSASVKGPDNNYVPSTLERESDGLFHVRFVPAKAGKYTVDVSCAGEPVENSPFVMKIAEPENVQVQLKQFEEQVRWTPRRMNREARVRRIDGQADSWI